MVSANIGITLMPELAVEDDSKSIRYLPFDGDPPHRVIGIAWRATSTREALLARLAEVLEGQVQTTLPVTDEEAAALA
jgi:LysR family hydrogen peroxide-inducible transcriptional activator